MLVVQCKIDRSDIRVINGYGPQEDDPANKRLLFWQSIEQEIAAAKNANCMSLIQMDGNQAGSN